MPVTSPPEQVEPDEIAAVAALHGLALNADELRFYARRCGASLESYARIAELFEGLAAAPPARPVGVRPSPQDDPLGVWAWRAERKGERDGPLAGLQVAVKDMIAVAGMPMGAGTELLAGHVPRTDATVVARLLAAGATIVGKTRCESLSFSSGSHTSQGGPVRNPHDPTRSAGGSSSGSAVAVATGAADAALGTDLAGSIRTPASFCGIYGLKPTFGLVSSAGVLAIEPTLDHVGPMAADVATLQRVFAALAGGDSEARDRPPASLGGMRLGVLSEGFGLAGSEPEVDECVRAAAELLARHGAEVAEVSLPLHADAIHIWVTLAMQGSLERLIRGSGGGAVAELEPELIQALAEGLRHHGDRLSPTAREMVLTGELAMRRFRGGAGAQARALAGRLRAEYDRLLTGVDVLLAPTNPMRATPLPRDGADLDEIHLRSTEPIVNTCAFNVTGHPAISIPCGLAGTLPVGLMAVAPHRREDLLLRLAAACEELMPPRAPSRDG